MPVIMSGPLLYFADTSFIGSASRHAADQQFGGVVTSHNVNVT